MHDNRVSRSVRLCNGQVVCVQIHAHGPCDAGDRLGPLDFGAGEHPPSLLITKEPEGESRPDFQRRFQGFGPTGEGDLEGEMLPFNSDGMRQSELHLEAAIPQRL